VVAFSGFYEPPCIANVVGWLIPGRISRTSVVMTQGDSVSWQVKSR
jgi:hypothetical protein